MIGKLLVPSVWGIAESIFFASLPFILKPKKSYKLVDTFFILLLVFICVRSFHTTQQHGISPNPDYSRLKANYFTLGHFIGRVIPYYYGGLSDTPPYSAKEPKITSAPLAKNIIFVVGESQNTNNMGVFGYDRDTTPFLSYLAKNNNQAIIKPTISGALMTAVALPTLFNAIEKPNGSLQISKGTTNLFYLAKKQGYNTQFYSAQAENQMMIMNIIGLRWIDRMVFPTELGYKKSENMPDSYLLDYLKKVDLNSAQPNFVILHQRGSHVPYGSLLNDEDHVFGTETIIDKYDNTIHKTDQLLQSIYDYLNSSGKDDWILVFTSDHGQNVSNETFNHGQFTTSSYTVPALVYSPNNQIQSDIKEQFDPCNTLFHQQISTLLISLMGYDLPISNCKIGYVNGNLLTGDSGYLEINQETHEIKKIK
ncbi:sulfatase-like hydrolase/transferase [Orbus sturtevantii]|uniref:phosphoethanolamine transferase n=1 Tax=Orbus sturtevantii TaxID=3074109 RepID=UPI00370DABE1